MKRTLILLALHLGFFAATGFAADKYPLETCVVSGEKLGTMGKAYVHKHADREVLLCCKSCVEDFEKEPAKFLSKLDAAAPGKK